MGLLSWFEKKADESALNASRQSMLEILAFLETRRDGAVLLAYEMVRGLVAGQGHLYRPGMSDREFFAAITDGHRRASPSATRQIAEKIANAAKNTMSGSPVDAQAMRALAGYYMAVSLEGTSKHWVAAAALVGDYLKVFEGASRLIEWHENQRASEQRPSTPNAHAAVTYDAWLLRFKEAAWTERPVLKPNEDGLSIIDLLDDSPLKRAHADGIDPVQLGTKFAKDFDIFKLGTMP